MPLPAVPKGGHALTRHREEDNVQELCLVQCEHQRSASTVASYGLSSVRLKSPATRLFVWQSVPGTCYHKGIRHNCFFFSGEPPVSCRDMWKIVTRCWTHWRCNCIYPKCNYILGNVIALKNVTHKGADVITFTLLHYSIVITYTIPIAKED